MCQGTLHLAGNCGVAGSSPAAVALEPLPSVCRRLCLLLLICLDSLGVFQWGNFLPIGQLFLAARELTMRLTGVPEFWKAPSSKIKTHDRVLGRLKHSGNEEDSDCTARCALLEVVGFHASAVMAKSKQRSLFGRAGQAMARLYLGQAGIILERNRIMLVHSLDTPRRVRALPAV